MADYDLIIIGAGPGGYVAAIRAAQLGMKVACVEKEATLGGTCLNVGCIPSKALLYSSEKYAELLHQTEDHGIKIGKVELDLAKLMQRKEKIVKQLTAGIGFLFKKNKITHINGTASFVDEQNIKVKSSKESKLSAKNFIIATGSSSIAIPSIPIDEKSTVTSTGALSLSSVPKTMLVIGGGYIGLEMGSVWSRLGTKVTVVEALDQIVPTMDAEIAAQFMKSLQKQGLEFKLSHKVITTKPGTSDVEVTMELTKDKKQIKEKYNIVLMSVGRKPNTQGLNLEKIGIKLNEQKAIEVDHRFKTNVDGIYAIGDVVPGPMLAHKAEEEGIACVEIINGQKTHMNYDTMPAIVYTNPEVASVGKTEEQLKESKTEYKVGKFPFMANGRALTTSATEGFVKILVDKKTDSILGAHIIGHDAGQLIAEIVTAMEFGGSAEDIARICHAHPTTSEAVKESALNADGRAIHI
ncbi:MAG: dihydrolipoyl dehydrogenase [Pelagibacteraceae bacterium]|jgi:dihydrolipoamide dehydrogenase|nr:dihydrolipoyl dehydrogenase [Pelagibacteraceae bacterium]MDP6784293.1 dihydrolipoyl dehydrogenase [Alphaproteobacteria bacterium]MBO6468052.1 dihydrolipoyl dehydrogenase [Pelagibacteraceae bacterium]MBO6469735.1 dihydrolipoyl dehydrogenase [Pelagibacteraceae bacterium]MBO6471726.1 dihydrolipoyl dehydrogenase [Pelagibacteraceae bacterium]|tara:strand:+ start:261 stop:1658 length:1398 start_codon:yes stop_codon:yes gene_type:complete